MNWSITANQLYVQFGTLNPLQWLTGPLLHATFASLVFNMIGLWAMGLVVEGKVGSRTFLLLFFTVAIAHAGILQILMLFSQGGSYAGVSAALMGLLGLAVIWAPRNSFEVWVGPYIGVHEVPILVYAFLLLALSGLWSGMSFSFLSSGLGLLLGLFLGYQWLQKGWVDCEGWDLPSVLKNEHISPRQSSDALELEREAQALLQAAKQKQGTNESGSRSPAATPPSASTSPAPVGAHDEPDNSPAQPEHQRKRSAQQDVEQLIFDGHAATAIKMHSRLQQSGVELELSQPAVARLIRDLLGADSFEEAIPWMRQHIGRFEQSRLALQLNLAKVYLHLERPQKALQTLKELDRGSLDEKGQRSFSLLVAHARQQIDEGVIELSD